jgi:hypothetical protein
VKDGLPASDFTSINNSSKNLFICGHIQAMQVCKADKYVYVKANCIPGTKDRTGQDLSAAHGHPTQWL